MKKSISAILCACLLITACAIPASAKEKESDLCFALASDLHYNAPSEELEITNSDPVFGYANRRAALEEESGFIIDEFLNSCAEDDSIEYVLISGDLADNGKTRRQDHIAVAEKLARFEETSGKQVFVINGNHDNGIDCSTTREDFINIYSAFGYDEALTKTDYDCSYTADLGEKYRLIALDSNDLSKSTEDGMSLKKVNWVLKQAKKAYEDGRYPVLMMHHNLLDHLPMQRIISRNFIVRFHYSTATLFADAGIRLVMSGHEHCSDATSFTTPSGNTIYDLATTSLTMYPLTYRVLSLKGEEINYESRTVDKIDTDALLEAQPLLSTVQTDAMNNGMNAYAFDFLKTGVEYRLALSLTPEKMGISEKDFYYNPVMTAVNGLTSILEMPLYGENSVEELAKGYGISIPESDYKNLWDLATTLVGAHYAGEENYSLESDEVKILLRGVSLILKDDLSGFSDEIIIGWANSLLAKNCTDGMTKTLTKLCSNAFGGIRPDEYMAAAMLAPFLYEFAFDSDGVNDNHGTLKGYEAKSGISDAFSSLTAVFNKMITYLRLYFSVIAKIFTVK